MDQVALAAAELLRAFRATVRALVRMRFRVLPVALAAGETLSAVAASVFRSFGMLLQPMIVQFAFVLEILRANFACEHFRPMNPLVPLHLLFGDEFFLALRTREWSFQLTHLLHRRPPNDWLLHTPFADFIFLWTFLDRFLRPVGLHVMDFQMREQRVFARKA